MMHCWQRKPSIRYLFPQHKPNHPCCAISTTRHTASSKKRALMLYVTATQQAAKRKMMQIYVFSSHPEIPPTFLLFCVVKRFLLVTKTFVVSPGSLGTNNKYSLCFFSHVGGAAFSSLKQKDFIPKHSSATLQNRDVG